MGFNGTILDVRLVLLTVKVFFMQVLQIKGNWNILKGKLKQTWASLTEDEVFYAEGKADEKIGRVQWKTAKAKAAFNKWLKKHAE